MSVAPSPAPETPRGDERAADTGGQGPRRFPFGGRASELRTFESLGDRNFRWFFISTLGQFGASRRRCWRWASSSTS